MEGERGWLLSCRAPGATGDTGVPPLLKATALVSTLGSLTAPSWQRDSNQILPIPSLPRAPQGGLAVSRTSPRCTNTCIPETEERRGQQDTPLAGRSPCAEDLYLILPLAPFYRCGNRGSERVSRVHVPAKDPRAGRKLRVVSERWVRDFARSHTKCQAVTLRLSRGPFGVHGPQGPSLPSLAAAPP